MRVSTIGLTVTYLVTMSLFAVDQIIQTVKDSDSKLPTTNWQISANTQICFQIIAARASGQLQKFWNLPKNF